MNSVYKEPKPITVVSETVIHARMSLILDNGTFEVKSEIAEWLNDHKIAWVAPEDLVEGNHHVSMKRRGFGFFLIIVFGDKNDAFEFRMRWL